MVRKGSKRSLWLERGWEAVKTTGCYKPLCTSVGCFHTIFMVLST